MGETTVSTMQVWPREMNFKLSKNITHLFLPRPAKCPDPNVVLFVARLDPPANYFLADSSGYRLS